MSDFLPPGPEGEAERVEEKLAWATAENRATTLINHIVGGLVLLALVITFCLCLLKLVGVL